MWDKQYNDYRQNGLQEMCPARPGPERAEWHLKRMYFACRRFVEALESNEPTHEKERAAGAVGIATREPGWAVFSHAFTTAQHLVLDEAYEKHGIYEDEMTKWEVTVTADWENHKVTTNRTEQVCFPKRLFQCTCGEAEAEEVGEPALPHKTTCPKA